MTTLTTSEPTRGNKLPLYELAQHIDWLRDRNRGEFATLARLDPRSLQPHQIAALASALVKVGLEPEHWKQENWQNWAHIARGIALAKHSGGELGEQLARAGVSELRVTKLLTARGDAFLQGLSPLLRLLASKEVAPNWKQLGYLVLFGSSDEADKRERAEDIRFRIAGNYFTAKAQAA